MPPAAILIGVDYDGDAGDGAELHIVHARREVGGPQAHRGAAVTAAPRDVHDQVAVLDPQALEQVERRGRGRYSLWTGDLGVALYAVDCLEPRTSYPILETWE